MSDRTSPTQSTEVPEEAVELVLKDAEDRSPSAFGSYERDQRRHWIRHELGVAAPALLKQGAEEERERLLSADSLRAIARHRHNADHKEGFDDLEWDDLPLERQMRAMDHAKADLLSAFGASESRIPPEQVDTGEAFEDGGEDAEQAAQDTLDNQEAP